MRSDPNHNAANSSVTDLIRKCASEMVMSAEGEGMSRAEMLANILWTVAIYKEVTLPNGTIVKATNSEWLEVAWRLIERIEGKPMQAINADIKSGVVVLRGSSRFEDSFGQALHQLSDTPGVNTGDGTLVHEIIDA